MSNLWAAKNPEKWRAYKAEWERKNPDKCKVYRKRWEANNPLYREINKEVFAERTKRYWRENKHRMIPQSLLRAARRRAKTFGLEFTITARDIIVPSECPLLGTELVLGEGKQGPNSPSLDRINNSRGYTPDNIWVISQRANTCKGNLSADEIIQIGLRLKEMETVVSLKGGARV